MTQHTTGNRQEAEGNGTDVSNLGDYSNIVVQTTDGKEINVRLYGR